MKNPKPNTPYYYLLGLDREDNTWVDINGFFTKEECRTEREYADQYQYRRFTIVATTYSMPINTILDMANFQ